MTDSDDGDPFNAVREACWLIFGVFLSHVCFFVRGRRCPECFLPLRRWIYMEQGVNKNKYESKEERREFKKASRWIYIP